MCPWLLVRVSKKDQDWQRQVSDLSTVATARGWHAVGKPSRKPRRFRLRYDEVVAIRLYVFPEPIQVALVPLGKVQRVSLNLARWVEFPDWRAGTTR